MSNVRNAMLLWNLRLELLYIEYKELL